eukprot:GSChrysophyteH1.ASY1.ANO1.582.1 assembled CDS
MNKLLKLENISASVKAASYAVRGAVVARSAELNAQLQEGKSLPFEHLVLCNIGNPQALKQRPVSFIRDVVSLVVNPELVERMPGVFKPDVIARAQAYLSGPGERDGFPANPDNIFLTNGASEGVRMCMQTIMRPSSAGFKDGVLTPIPQYPLYSALTTLLDGHLVPYYLDEAQGWACTKQMLEESMAKAADEGINTRCL